MSSRRRPPNLVAIELTRYFLSADTVQGMQSSWAPLVGLAMGGFGGTSDPERRVTERRFGWPGRERGDLGAPTRTEIAEVRDTRNALLALPRCPPGEPSYYDILYAAYGSIPWEKIVDEGFGVGMALKVTTFLEPRLLGPALLTADVRRGFELARAAEQVPLKPGKLVTTRSANLDKPFENEELFYEGRTVDAYRVGRVDQPRLQMVWRTPGGWLVTLCLKAQLGEKGGQRMSRTKRKRAEEEAAAAKERLALIQGQALQLLAAAEAVYREARFPPGEEVGSVGVDLAALEEPAPDEPRPEPEPPRRRRGASRPKALPAMSMGGGR